MNILLTGEIQVGKSTLIKKVLAMHPDWKIGGFVTVTRFRDIPGAIGGVYIQNAPGSDVFEKNNLVGVRYDDRAESYPEVFDGVAYELFADKSADLILMDELGKMEAKAEVFKSSVLEVLQSNKPVLGVIKPNNTPFLNAIREIPSTVLVTVTQNNRDELLPFLDRLVMYAVEMDR